MRYKDLSDEEQLALAEEDEIEADSIAFDPRTSPWVLDQLVERGICFRKFFLAGNPSARPETLRKLYDEVMPGCAGPDAFGVMFGLAENTSTPLDILGRISESIFAFPQLGLEKNPSTPKYLFLECDSGDLLQNAFTGIRIKLFGFVLGDGAILECDRGQVKIVKRQGLLKNSWVPL